MSLFASRLALGLWLVAIGSFLVVLVQIAQDEGLISAAMLPTVAIGPALFGALVGHGLGRLIRLGVQPQTRRIGRADGIFVTLVAVGAFVTGVVASDARPDAHWVLSALFSTPIVVLLAWRGRTGLGGSILFATAVALAFLLAVIAALEVADHVDGTLGAALFGASGSVVGAGLSLTGLWPLGGGFRRPGAGVFGTGVLTVIAAGAFLLLFGDAPPLEGVAEKAFPYVLYIPWQSAFAAYLIWAFNAPEPGKAA